MQNKRQFKRFEIVKIQGKMSLANKVEIVDISLGGVALKADRRLEIGREYMIKLGDADNSIDIRGMIVRCSLSGMEPGEDGESVLIYSAGMRFKDGSEKKIEAFLNSVVHETKEDPSPAADRRQHVRFQISGPEQEVLVCPAHFKIKDIGLNNMLIQSWQSMDKGSTIPLALHLDDDNHLEFSGQVFSCTKIDDGMKISYDIDVCYPDLSDDKRSQLKVFIDYLIEDPEA